LREGEYAARITAPEILYEKKFDKTLGPAIFYGHFLFDSEEEARTQATKEVRQGFETRLRKARAKAERELLVDGKAFTEADLPHFTEEDVLKSVSEIKTVML
jgi:hypothetical protein